MNENKTTNTAETTPANAVGCCDVLSKCDTCDRINRNTRTAKFGYDEVSLLPKTIQVCDECVNTFAKDDIEFDFIDNTKDTAHTVLPSSDCY